MDDDSDDDVDDVDDDDGDKDDDDDDDICSPEGFFYCGRTIGPGDLQCGAHGCQK